MSEGTLLSEKRRWTEGLTGYHYLVLIVACLGWSFDTLDQWLYVFVKQHALTELLGAGASAGDITTCTGYAQSCLLLGWATGGLLFGMIGDRLGRTRTMALTILMYAGFTGLSGLAQTWQQFAALRFLTGMGVGGEFAAGAALVAETFPAHSRVTALSVVQATSALGNVAASLINLTIAQFFNPATAWRWVFAIGIIPALLVFVIFAFIREPEKWQEARAAAKAAKKAGKKAAVGSIFGLFAEPVVRRNTLVGVGLAAIGVIGFWGISTWSPELIRNALKVTQPDATKGTVETYVSFAGMAQNIGGFFGALLFGFLANRIGRRWTFFASLVACSVVCPATFVFTGSVYLTIAMCFGMGFVLLFLLGGFAVYFPELFPTRLRATGTGFCYNVARFVSAASPTAFGKLSGAIGIPWAAVSLSSIFVLGLAILPFAPETKDKPLPE